MTKTYLFIDGSNLYGGQYELFGPFEYLNFSKFIQQVESKLKIRFDKIYFYSSYSPIPKKPTKKQKLYLKNEALFYKSVKKTPRTIFFSGYRSKTSGKEKEVDVKLTADLVSFAFLDRFDIAYLCTGDADFLQALFSIRQYHNKKRLYLLCLENKIMFQGLFHFTTHVVILKKKPILKKQYRNLKLYIKRPDMHARRVD